MVEEDQITKWYSNNYILMTVFDDLDIVFTIELGPIAKSTVTEYVLSISFA